MTSLESTLRELADGARAFAPLANCNAWQNARWMLALSALRPELVRDEDAFVAAADQSASDTPRPPPTQDALREIVRTDVPLTPKQRKQIAAALKSAPRLRDAHSQETYKALCAEVEQRLGARSK